MNPEHVYAVAETFLSLQGEGLYAGTPMFFIRLAGCNVGRGVGPYTQCTSCFGDSFVCDTDYRSKLRLTAAALEQMASESRAQHICITGGEPFVQDLEPLIDELLQPLGERMVHIETSGTRPIPNWVADYEQIWVACSPKAGFLESNARFVHEWKFVLREPIHSYQDARIKTIQRCAALNPETIVYIQPVNDVGAVNASALRQAIYLVQQHPEWRLSTQLQKVWDVR